MQYFYYLTYPNIIGKIVIAPINRVITLYVSYEEKKLLTFMHGLRHHLNSLGKYTEIFQNHTAHDDSVHCCEPDLLDPSHLHFSFEENITPENLSQLFNEILDNQTPEPAVHMHAR